MYNVKADKKRKKTIFENLAEMTGRLNRITRNYPGKTTDRTQKINNCAEVSLNFALKEFNIACKYSKEFQKISNTTNEMLLSLLKKELKFRS